MVIYYHRLEQHRSLHENLLALKMIATIINNSYVVRIEKQGIFKQKHYVYDGYCHHSCNMLMLDVTWLVRATLYEFIISCLTPYQPMHPIDTIYYHGHRASAGNRSCTVGM